jgi:drug/metabolite transporter (DMT)-like permease
LLAAALAIASSLTWGTGDFFGGLISRRRAVLAVLFISQGTGLALIATVIAIRGFDPSAGASLWFAAIAGTVGMVALAAFYRGLAIGAMGVVAPISGFAAAIPVIVGVAGGERPEPLQWVGISVALLGIALVAREAPVKTPAAMGNPEAVAPQAEPARGRAPLAAGVGLALIAALGFGAFLTLMDFAADPDPLLATLVSRTASVSVLALAVLVARPSMNVGRRDGLIVMGIGCLDLTANALYAIATTEGLLSVVAVLGSLYPLVPAVLAWLILKERISGVQRVGSVLAIGGALMLAATT